MRRAGLLLALAGALTACGDDGVAPTVSNLTVSSTRGVSGLESFLRATVEDPEGDLAQGMLHVTARAVSGGLELDASTPILDFEDGRTRGDVVVGFTLFGRAPIGVYAVELVAEDEAGRRSEPAAVEVDFSR